MLSGYDGKREAYDLAPLVGVRFEECLALEIQRSDINRVETDRENPKIIEYLTGI